MATQDVALARPAPLRRQPALSPEIQPQQRQRHDLRGECLGRRHSHLGPRVQVEPASAFARDRAPHHVDEPQHPRPRGARRAQRFQRIRRLPRLRDRQRQRPPPRCHERPPVAVLRCVLHLHGDSRQLLDQVASHQPRVPRRSAPHDHDALDRATVLGGEVQAVQTRAPRLGQEPPA